MPPAPLPGLLHQQNVRSHLRRAAAPKLDRLEPRQRKGFVIVVTAGGRLPGLFLDQPGSQTGSQAASSHSNQSFAEHDLNMQLDRGFRAVFACWMHVFSEAEFRISVHEKSSLLAAEFEKVC